MKKTLILVALALAISGCNATPYSEKEIYHSGGACIKRIEYNGHYYLQFGSGYSSSYVHDPDCPCNKIKEE